MNIADYIDMECVVLAAFLFVIGVLVCVVIFGPILFQGYRNSKFIDDLKKERKKTINMKDLEP